MSAWVLVPALVALREEFNRLSPNRDKGADGSIGDSAHTSSSDHTPDEDSDVLRDHDADHKNEVHALDIDSTGPWPDTSFDAIVKGIIARERKRWLDPNDKCRLKYVIWNRRIYSQGNDFNGEAYTLADPHTNHAHFSGRYETVCENDTSPWGVFEEDDLPMDQATFNKLMSGWAKSAEGRDALSDAVLQTLLPAPAGSNDADGKWWLQSFITNTYPAAVSARTYAAEGRDKAGAAYERANEAVTIAERTEAKVGQVLSTLAPAPAGTATTQAPCTPQG